MNIDAVSVHIPYKHECQTGQIWISSRTVVPKSLAAKSRGQCKGNIYLSGNCEVSRHTAGILARCGGIDQLSLYRCCKGHEVEARRMRSIPKILGQEDA